MNIKRKEPPNFQEIKLNLPITENSVFCYGDTIYTLSKEPIPEDIIEHEQIHSKQQGNDPADWWQTYLKDSNFRLEQELEAYVYQYKYAKEKHGSAAAKMCLEELAQNLAKCYNIEVDYHKAHSLIRHAI